MIKKYFQDEDIIKIVKSLENPGLLIDADTETAKHKIKKKQEFLAATMVSVAALLIALMTSSLI